MSIADVFPVLPWDMAAVTAEACDILRIGTLDPDYERVRLYATSATWLIEGYVEPVATWEGIPEPMFRAAAFVTVELYRRKDAPFGVMNAWSPDDYGPVRIGPDPLNGVRWMLLPYKAAWGVA